jgi:two-component system cell cycle sensor histidine kinase/response regulator CckA
MNTTISNGHPLRLLHIEDSVLDAELIHARLRKHWPECEIKRVDTRADFLASLTGPPVDLILSDFSLPSFNGLEALGLARQQAPSIPFMFLSGTIGEESAVLALQRGAVDYVIKDRPARLIPAMERALEQRRELRRREEAEQRMIEQAGLLDKARDAVCVTDLDGRVTYWNRSAAALFGWNGEEGQGRKLQDLFSRSGQELTTAALAQLHATGSWNGELRLPDRGYEARYLDSRWTLVKEADGRPQSILLISTDVTEQKKLEAQLLRTQRLEGIGTLAGGIAHDLNNVLSPILMSVDLLRTSLEDEPSLQIVDMVEKSAQHGAALIRQLLAFARGADGERMEMQPQLVIKEVVKLLGDTLPRSITIEADLPPDLWSIRANSTQLSQVFMNLGINARDAMPGGGKLTFRAENITLTEKEAQVNPGAKAGRHVRISVADSGTGIPPELLERIFDPFFTTKAPGKGTGLGLSTVVGILKGHGGFLQVQSGIGQGTEFQLYFPAGAENPVLAAGAIASAPPFSRGRGETVLVIDDEEGVRKIVSALLFAQGYKVLVASNGFDGIVLYQEHRQRVQVVLTDMMMPGLQGADVVRELRLLDPDVRIVAMSGISTELAALPQEHGRLAVLAKPMTGPELVQAIQSVMPVRAAAENQANDLN